MKGTEGDCERLVRGHHSGTGLLELRGRYTHRPIVGFLGKPCCDNEVCIFNLSKESYSEEAHYEFAFLYFHHLPEIIILLVALGSSTQDGCCDDFKEKVATPACAKRPIAMKETSLSQHQGVSHMQVLQSSLRS